MNDIEKVLENVKRTQGNTGKDVALWRRNSGYKPIFSTYETWQLTREAGVLCTWGAGIWFSQATQKFVFMAWLAMRNRLATMDRVAGWSQGVDTTCVLCNNAPESRNHFFFECPFSSQLWAHLTRGFLQRSFSTNWDAVVRLIIAPGMGKQKRFCLRYAFQLALYTLWRERNKRRHGEKAMPLQVLAKLTEKAIRNKLSLLQSKRAKGYEGVLQYWFSTRL